MTNRQISAAPHQGREVSSRRTQTIAEKRCAKMLKETPNISHLKFGGSEITKQAVLRHRQAIKTLLPLVEDAMRPASISEINTVIETLSQMYYERVRDADQAKLWVDAFTRGVRSWPSDLLWAACDDWIANGPSHMPTPSALKKHIQKRLTERRVFLARTRTALDWLEANPKERPYVESAKNKAMREKIKTAITSASKSKPMSEAEIDEKRLNMERAQKRAEQARKADAFIAAHKAANPKEYKRSIIGDQNDTEK